MSKQTFPVFVDQPGCTMRNFKVTGASVGATAGTDGLDGRGKYLCTISKSTNQVTINWVPSFGDVPYVFIQPLTANVNVEIVSSTASQLVINTWKSDDHTTGVNDVDFYVHVDSYNTTSFVS